MNTSPSKLGNIESKYFDNLFNNRLINSLPYLFWMYELIGGDYKLIKWNKNFETVTGYNAEELFHMSTFDFFSKDPNVIRRLSKTIKDGFKKGSANIYVNLRVKSGKLIPYYFEGYTYNDDQKYFLGIGVDASEMAELKNNLLSLKKEKETILRKNNKLKRELLTYTIEFEEIKKLKQLIENKLKELHKYNKKEDILTEINQIQKEIKNLYIDKDYWEIFKLRFNNINPSFFKELKSKFPDLTKTELQYCAYLKIHLSTSQIASILNISKEGINKKRYRLRKKIGCNKKDCLEEFIKQF
ncbi:MAG: PAS domain S-box protein [Bacteroidota bacterium]